jgi:hypothetical protein
MPPHCHQQRRNIKTCSSIVGAPSTILTCERTRRWWLMFCGLRSSDRHHLLKKHCFICKTVNNICNDSIILSLKNLVESFHFHLWHHWKTPLALTSFKRKLLTSKRFYLVLLLQCPGTEWSKRKHLRLITCLILLNRSTSKQKKLLK